MRSIRRHYSFPGSSECTTWRAADFGLTSGQQIWQFPSAQTGGFVKVLLHRVRIAKFFILCNVIFLVRLQGKFEIDHS